MLSSVAIGAPERRPFFALRAVRPLLRLAIPLAQCAGNAPPGRERGVGYNFRFTPEPS